MNNDLRYYGNPMNWEGVKGDLISRSALKEAIIKWFNLNDVHNQYWWNRVKAIIDNAPTVELFCSYMSDEEVKQPCIEAPCKHERPQGEWIYHKSDGYFLPYMECSNCKVQDLLENLTKKEYREVNHFCFNCGAKMKGGAE